MSPPAPRSKRHRFWRVLGSALLAVVVFCAALYVLEALKELPALSVGEWTAIGTVAASLVAAFTLLWAIYTWREDRAERALDRREREQERAERAKDRAATLEVRVEKRQVPRFQVYGQAAGRPARGTPLVEIQEVVLYNHGPGIAQKVQGTRTTDFDFADDDDDPRPVGHRGGRMVRRVENYELDREYLQPRDRVVLFEAMPSNPSRLTVWFELEGEDLDGNPTKHIRGGVVWVPMSAWGGDNEELWKEADDLPPWDDEVERKDTPTK